MAFFKWKDEYSVHIDSIDEQHKEILTIMDELRDGIKDNHKIESLNKMITSLTQYCDDHFSQEEQIMRDNKFPEFESHVKLHEYFTTKVKELSYQKAEDGVLLTDCIIFLKEWFLDHILVQDKKYSEYFQLHKLI